MNIQQLKKSINNILDQNTSASEKLQNICNYLKQEIDYYDWVGFYFKNGGKNELKLAQFAGEPTDHVIIPFGKGICGQVALSNENFIVPDVTAQDNYISCGWKVKSEIVKSSLYNDVLDKITKHTEELVDTQPKIVKLDLYFVPVFWLLMDQDVFHFTKEYIKKQYSDLMLKFE